MLAAEVRQSLRGLRRNPGLTILGTAMLALGTERQKLSTEMTALLKSAALRSDLRHVI